MRTAVEEWPAEELEYFGRCILCESRSRCPAYVGLIDRLAGCPGSWNPYQCLACGSLTLDPRPSKRSIARAYVRYHTHEVQEPLVQGTSVEASLVRKARNALGRALDNDYLNRTYGYNRSPAIFGGALLARMGVKPLRWRALDYRIRHLCAPRLGGRLLDVGCGHGDFIKLAGELGYSALGIDPDPAAVRLARSRGLITTVGSMPGSNLEREGFDQICLNHVFEHLHHPRAALVEMFGLLRPGGRLWLAMPNPKSHGLKRMGGAWRGLEPPRHLGLYPAAALRELLHTSGFAGIKLLPAEPIARFLFKVGARINQGMRETETVDPSGWPELERAANAADRETLHCADHAEYLTMIAYKR